MKKKTAMVLAILLILVAGVSAWFWGYYTRKSNDNLPTLSAVAEMSEPDINSLLAGYRHNQLREVWGEPDGCLSGFWGEVWQIEGAGSQQLVVYYNEDGIVEHVKLRDSAE